MSLKDTISEATKDAMRARDKARLATLRLINAELKRIEVDERIDLDDERIVTILDRMLKQRRESEEQFRNAGRTELADGELFEAGVIREFMPEPLDDEALAELIAAAISESGASGMRDMGKVMQILRPQVQGRADMGALSQKVKAQLGD